MIEHKVSCNQCGNDLTHTGNCIDYRIALCNERIPSKGSAAVTDMHISPPIEHPMHFCSIRCLCGTVEKWINQQKLWECKET